MKKRKVVWAIEAIASLNAFCDYISRDSPSAAKRVRKEIVLTAKKLATHPEIFQLDEYFTEGENIRRFFRWSYRVVYQVLEKEIVILGIFHTKTSTEED